MIEKPRILVISSANIDLIARMNSMPSVGSTIVENNRYDYAPGGKGANSALAVARLGGESIFCCKLGNDTHGRQLTQIYAQNGIETRFITHDPKERTGLALCMVESGAQNRIVVYPGANRRLRPSDIEEAFTCYPDAVYLQLEIPDETVLAACDYAREQQIPIFIDAGPARTDFPLESLGEIELFSPNEEETYTYTGIRPTSVESCLKACIALSQRVKANYYVLKLGTRGCYAYDGKLFHIIKGYEPELTDTTGAGDVFTAALTIEFLRTGDIKKACEFANLAGAVTTEKQGAFASVPGEADLMEFLKKQRNYSE